MIRSRIVVLAAGLLLVLISPVNAEPTGKLYAFANPLPGPLKAADHTWVTDYQSRPTQTRTTGTARVLAIQMSPTKTLDLYLQPMRILA